MLLFGKKFVVSLNIFVRDCRSDLCFDNVKKMKDGEKCFPFKF